MNTFYFPELERQIILFACDRASEYIRTYEKVYSEDEFHKYCLENENKGSWAFYLKIKQIINIMDATDLVLTPDLKQALIQILKHRSYEVRDFKIKKENFRKYCKTRGLKNTYKIYRCVEAILKKVEDM